MKHMYELTEEMSALLEADEVDETALATVFGDIATKSENICHFIANVEGEAAKFEAEEKRIGARRKALENMAAKTREYLKRNMLDLGIPKISAGTFTPTIQNNSQPSLIADDERIAPSEYLDIIPQQLIPAKDRIKEALAAGKEVPGWRLERGKHLRIR